MLTRCPCALSHDSREKYSWLVSVATERGCLLIADISGYTDYVVSSPLEYAEEVVADITQDVVARLEPVLRVNKLEGDAAFGYALDGEIDASMLLDSIEECYFGFRRRLRGIEHSTNCSCNACTKAPELNLKFVVHHGDFIRRLSSRGEELTGQDVILVHRLALFARRRGGRFAHDGFRGGRDGRHPGDDACRPGGRGGRLALRRPAI